MGKKMPKHPPNELFVIVNCQIVWYIEGIIYYYLTL